MFNALNLIAAEGGSTWLVWVLVALMVVFLFVVPMFTNRKRQKEVNEVLDSLAVGDEIMTIGGIMGKVIDLSTHESGEKLMVIETGDGENKTTMTFTIQALRLNYTKTKARQEQLAKAKAEKDAAKNKSEENEKELPLVPVEQEEEVSVEESKEENSEPETK